MLSRLIKLFILTLIMQLIHAQFQFHVQLENPLMAGYKHQSPQRHRDSSLPRFSE